MLSKFSSGCFHFVVDSHLKVLQPHEVPRCSFETQLLPLHHGYYCVTCLSVIGNFWNTNILNRCICLVNLVDSLAIFFPRVILYYFFLFLLVYGGLGFWGWGLRLGFWG